MLSCPKDTGLHWLFLKEHPCPVLMPSGPMCHNLQLNIRISLYHGYSARLVEEGWVILYLHQIKLTYPGLATTGSHWELRNLAVVLVLQAIIPLGLTWLATIILILSAGSHRAKFCLNNAALYASTELKPRVGTEKIALRANMSPNRKETLRPVPRPFSRHLASAPAITDKDKCGKWRERNVL